MNVHILIKNAHVLLGVVVLLCLLSTSVDAQQWPFLQPPPSFFTPDIDVTSTTRLPRVPPSPYGLPANICPARDGVPYAVAGFPGTPYIITPFTTLYRSPVDAQPTATVCRTGDPTPAHCMTAYDMEIKAIQARPWDVTIPGCQSQPPTNLLAYNGTIPGPTITAPVGHEVLVRFTNTLNSSYFNITQPPCVGTRNGRPFAVHLHGSESLSPFDGWAEDNICGGETKEYIYPNQRATTGWYHDHALHITLDNAYHGLAGFYLMSDKIKHGSCGEPYNLEDIEERLMILKDVVLTPQCQLYYDFAGPHDRNLYGDINTINGVPFPEVPLEPKWYRFRLLNAAVSRPWLIKFKNQFGRNVGPEICRVIASDGGFRGEAIPFPPEGLQMGVAERYEVVCNFAPYAGRQLYLWNGNNPAMFKDVPYFCHSHLLAHITVGRTTSIPNPPAVDERLLPPNPMPLNKVLTQADIAAARQLIAQNNPTRTFDFERRRGQWVINGETWASATIAAADVGQNTWELWLFRTGGGWFHPVHVHLVDFFVMRRGNLAGSDGLFAFERDTPKDMLFLGPSQELWVLARFGAHRGSYMFHCHNLDHEDHDMMRAYTIVGGAGQDNMPVLNPSTTLQPITTVAGVIYNNWEYSDPLAPSRSARPAATWPALTPAYLQTQVDLNLYRIFYPQTTDLAGLQADVNPWYSRVCQTLPLLP